MHRLICLLSFVFIASPIFSFTLNGLFPAMGQDDLDKLVIEGVLRQSVAKPSLLSYMPDVPIFFAYQDYLIRLDTRSNIEAVYYIQNISSVPLLKLMNSVLQVSTLSGLQFYSRSEKKVKTLIYNVSVIDENSPNAQRLPDLSLTKIVPEVNFIIRQNDETFGEANYQITLTYSPENYMAVRIVNLQPLKKGIITMAKAGEFDFMMALFPVNNNLVIYEVTTTRQAPPSFIKKNVDQSQYNRFDAFKNWILERYNEALSS